MKQTRPDQSLITRRALIGHQHLEMKVWAAQHCCTNEVQPCPPSSVSDPDSMFPCDFITFVCVLRFISPSAQSVAIHPSSRTASSSTARASPPFCFSSLSHPFWYLLSLARRITLLNCFQQSPLVKHFPFFVIKQQYKADLHKCDSGFACCTFHGG